MKVTECKTIAMNLQAVKEKKGDTFYKLKDDLKSMANVDLTDTNGELRSTFDIIVELTSNWDKLTEMQQSSLLQGIAGKQQARVLASIIQNAGKDGSHLTEIYNTLKNSTGSAMEEQERYMDSIEAKSNAFKESVKKIWIQTISSDVIKSALDGLTNIVTALSNVDGNTIKLIGSVIALGVALKSISTFSVALGSVGTLAELGKGSGVIGTLVGGFASLTNSIKSATLASLGFIATPLGLTLVALGVACVGAYSAYQSYKTLMEKPIDTPTEDLTGMERVVNSLSGNVLKSKKELQDAGIIYEDFGTNISDGFKQGVEDARKSLQQLSFELEKSTDMNLSDGDEQSGKVKKMVDNIVDSAKQSIESRKNELGDKFSTLFMDDGEIDSNERQVLDAITSEGNANFDKIAELHDNIYTVWNTAIAQHGQLSQEDVKVIRDYVAQIQQIQMEAKAENNTDWFDLKNKFLSRVKGLSIDDATAEYKTSNDELKDMYAKKKTIYDNGVADLERMKQKEQEILNEADKNGNEEQKAATQKTIDAIDEKIKAYQGKYTELVSQEAEKRRELVAEMVELNPNLRGQFNEITGEKFDDKDKDSNAKLMKLEQTYQSIDDVMQSGITKIKNTSTGLWNDVYVELDKETGKIVGTYNYSTGEFTGYTREYENQMKEFATSYKGFQDLFRNEGSFKSSFLEGETATLDDLGNFKLNGNVITQLKDLKTETDDAGNTIRKAITSINGQEIEIKANDKGAITNLNEIAHTLNLIPANKTIYIDAEGKTQIIDTIKGEIDNLPDKKECNISINGENETSIDSITEKLKDLPPETSVDIKINGEQLSTVEEVREKLGEIPPETDTNINVEANTQDADSNLDTTNAKADELNNKNISNTVNIDTSAANTGLQGIIDKILYIIEHPIDSFTNFVSGNGDKNADTEVGHNASGTNNWRGGLTWVNEQGGELMNLPNGTQIIPHDLSEQIIKESAKAKDVQPIITTVNIQPVDIYQGKAGTGGLNSINTSQTLDKPYESDAWVDKDTTYMSADEKKAYESAKKQYDIKKKQQDEEEKKLKDRATKEKQYLTDIAKSWESNQQSISNSLNNLELKEKEYGDNITIPQKIDILNQKWSYQASLIPEAEKQLNTYKNATVTTADAQEELNKKIQSATEALNKQKQTVAEAYNELKKYTLESITQTIDKQKEMYELKLDNKNNADKKALEDLKTQQEELHNQKLKDLNEELTALDTNNEEEERENTLLEKKNALKQAELDLERAKNQKTVYSYQKQKDGTYQFSWEADKTAVKSAQDTYNNAKKDLKDTKNNYELEDNKKEIQAQIDEENKLYDAKQKEMEKYEKSLSESYDKQKKLLDYYYQDTNKLAQDQLDELTKTYGNNFETISEVVNNKLTETKTKLDELNKSNIGYDIETVNKALSSDNIYEYVTTLQNKTNEGVAINLEGLKQKLSDLQTQDGEIEKEYDTHYTNTLTTQSKYQTDSRDSQNQYQQDYLDNFVLFSAQYVTLYDKMMQLLKMITDSGTNDITTMVQGAGQQVLNELTECKKAYDKFRDMWNYMHPDDTIPNIDISNVVSDFNSYKQSVADWQKSKEALFYANNNPLYNQEKYDKYVQLSQVGMTNFNALASVIKDVKGGGTTQTININGVEVNADNGQQFINSLLTMANQKLNTK